MADINSEFNPYSHIVRPIMTERSTIMKDKFNQYVFEVKLTSTKHDVKNAVERVFKVKVLGVRTMHVRGKDRRVGRFAGKRPDWKKAIVTLGAGQKIDLVEQAG